ncbi:MAG TPA: hypothetical protein VMZ66_09245 [Aeromicrobium sp.]|nr:hypothetical protein [Aeromicrobium sp.]
MIRRAAIAGLLMAVLATGTVSAATRTVNATDDDTFILRSTTVALNDSVQWRNTSPDRQHTSSSDLFSMWSLNLNPGTTSGTVLFQHAGLFAYHCDFHGNMTGSIKVKLTFTRNSNGTITVRFARANAASGFTHELQRKNPGQASFVTLPSTTAQTYTFTPTTDGTYKFRSRYRKVGGVATGFSPTLSIVVN